MTSTDRVRIQDHIADLKALADRWRPRSWKTKGRNEEFRIAAAERFGFSKRGMVYAQRAALAKMHAEDL